MAEDRKERPYFEASFLARLVRSPSFGGEKVPVMSGFVEFIQAVGDDRDGIVRFGSFPIKVFGAAAERMEKDKLAEGDFIEIRNATLMSQKKFKGGEEAEDADGKPIFETVLMIDDNVGEYAAVFSDKDVDEPEKPERNKGNGARGNARGSARGGSGRGRDDDRTDDRGRERDDDRGSDRGGARGSSARSGGGRSSGRSGSRR